MSKKLNPTILGLFIIAGLALVIGGIVLFGSFKFFTKTETYILYFDESVRGLSPEAPVKFRGVTVGKVLDLLIRHNQAPGDTHMPVIIEVDQGMLEEKSDAMLDLSDEVAFKKLIKQGLRGKLQTQSLLTGILYVELDIQSDALPPQFHQVKPEYKEIPTEPTDVKALMEKFQKIDLSKVLDQLNSTLAKAEARLDELNLAEISNTLTNLLTSLDQVVRSPDLTNSLTSLRRTLDEYRTLSEQLRNRVDPLADDVQGTLKEAEATLVELRVSLQNVRDMLAPEAALRHDLSLMMDSITEAVRSIDALADFLNRNPNAIITGRKHPESRR